MTPQTDLDSLREAGLLPHQAKFIADFLQPEAAHIQWLNASPGTGKTHMVFSLIPAFVGETGASHILILTPARVLVDYYARSLHDKGNAVPVVPIDKKRLRLLAADLPSHQGPFTNPIIAIMNIQQLADDNTAQAILGVEWDLVVVDEAHHLFIGSLLATFVERLISFNKAKRLLFLSIHGQDDRPPRYLPAQTRIVEWPNNILDWEGKPLLTSSETQLRLIAYERSPEEITFLRALQEIEGLDADERRHRLKKARLIKLASSSLYAIEQGLSRERNRLAHATPSMDIKNSYEEAEEGRSDVSMINEEVRPKPQRSKVLLEQLDRLLEMLEWIPEDKKLQALINLILELKVEKPTTRFWILTTYSSTAHYLTSSLHEIDEKLTSIEGTMSGSAIAKAVKDYQYSGGIVVSTPILLQGIDLSRSGIEILVYYDLLSREMMDQSLGRIMRIGTVPVILHTYALKDISDVLELESSRLEALGFED
jgi:superfamily II DNA or RNA helicase